MGTAGKRAEKSQVIAVSAGGDHVVLTSPSPPPQWDVH